MNQHKTQVWLYVILAAIITSCSPVSRREKDNLQKIDEAWDMSDHNLDSSIILFQNIQNSVYRSTEYVRMKYDLLGIRLRDKSYMMPYLDMGEPKKIILDRSLVNCHSKFNFKSM